MSSGTKAIEWIASNFSQFEKKLDGEKSSPLHGIRKKAFARFSELGFPSPQEEEWRFTNISKIASTHFGLPDAKSAVARHAPITFAEPHHSQLVFVNGFFAQALSSIRSDARADHISSVYRRDPEFVTAHLNTASHNTFKILNTAFVHDGAFIVIPDDVVLDEPIHLIHIGGDSLATHPRNLLIIGDNAEAKIIESYLGSPDEQYFNNPVTDIKVGENAHLSHVKLQRESARAFHIAVQEVSCGRNSTFVSHSISLGGAIVRNDIHAVLDGAGAECTLDGLYLGTGTQHIDNHTVIEHAKAHCHSHELYKGILDGEARAVFSGKIHVHRDAQKTDAIQSNRNLLLSNKATVNTKPQLEIFADDVRCTHGSTVGQIDEDGIFYLRSRGISQSSARNMMINAFASDILERMPIRAARRAVEGELRQRLKNGRLGGAKNEDN
jgi:Fe-S cluster assembly protein SufD